MTADVTDIILGAALGAVSGFISQRAAIVQMKARSDDASKLAAVKKPLFTVIWVIVAAFMGVGLFMSADNVLLKVEYLIYAAAALNVVVVDGSIRRIPNSTLIVMMAVRLAAIIANTVAGDSFIDQAVFSGAGLLIGFVLFIIPSFFHIPVGAGDIKFCSVVGMCIGLYGFAQSMILMSIGMLVYLIYLLATKKGTIKTVTAMGPFLAGGFIVTLMIPLQELLARISF